jgi:CelD/BcsL family acetyltransferase involved in cellulose biosynthesis
LICVAAEHDPRWRLMTEQPAASLFHSPAWLGALADTYGFDPQAALVFDSDERAVAGVSFCRIKDLGGERIVCSPFSDYCEPLSTSRDHWPVLRTALLGYGLPVSLRWRDGSGIDPGSDFVAVRRARWHGIGVEPPLDVLWTRISSAARRAVRKAGREGLTIGILEDPHLEHFIRLHVALRKRKYRLLAQPPVFFEALRRRFRCIDGWYPLAAWHRGRIVAVTVYLRWGDTLYYKFNASDAQALCLRPNDMLVWEGMRLARALGCREVDLGASDDSQPGLVRFKRRYSRDERQITQLASTRSVRASHADDLLLSHVTQVFTNPAVPDEVTQSAGAAWYRYFVS